MSPSREHKIHEIHSRGAERVERNAHDYRGGMINMAFDAIATYLIDQETDIAADIEQTKTLPRRVLWTTLGFEPSEEEGAPVEALMIELIPRKDIAGERIGEQKMRVYLPIAEGLYADDRFDPGLLVRPEFIIVEQYDMLGNPRCFKVTDRDIEEFDNPVHSEKPDSGLEELGLNVLRFMRPTVDPKAILAHDLYTDMLNWTSEIQRKVMPKPTEDLDG